MNKKLAIYGSAAVLVIGGLFFMGRLGSKSNQQASVSGVLNNADSVAEEFSLRGIDGKTYALSDYKDKQPVLLEFLAVWCPHCQNQTEVNGKIIKGNASRNIAFLSINASPFGRYYTLGNKADVAEEDLLWYKDKYGVSEPLLFDKGEVGQKYGLTGFPMFVLVDKSGKIVWQQSGEVSEEAIQAEIDKVLAEEASI